MSHEQASDGVTEGRHAYAAADAWAQPIGLVYFSRGANCWVRRIAPRTKWHGGLEIAATPEEVTTPRRRQ